MVPLNGLPGRAPYNRRMRHLPTARVLVLILLVAGLQSACGLKDDLFLPEKARAPVTTEPEATGIATQPADDEDDAGGATPVPRSNATAPTPATSAPQSAEKADSSTGSTSASKPPLQ